MDRLSAMEVFVRVIETGSFSAAARQLRVGQPAVSKTVAQLEDRLGVRLLLRSPRGLTPTEAGRLFYDQAKLSIEAADAADLAARGAVKELTGRLRFSAGVTLARLHIIPRLPAFLSAHPALKIEAVLDDRHVDLVEEGIDIAFRTGVTADSLQTARKIAQSPRLVLGSPAYFAESGEPTSPGDLARHRAIFFDLIGSDAKWTFRKAGKTASVTLQESLRITAAEGVREAVLAGLGLTVGTRWMFQPELDQGKVRAVLSDWTLPAIDLWAVYPSGRRTIAKARAFAAFVEDCLAQR